MKTQRRKGGDGGKVKLYIVIIIILISLVLLARDITPNHSVVTKDLTNNISDGDFIK